MGVSVQTLRGHHKEVLCAAFSPVARAVVTSSTDGTIRLWAVVGWERLQCFYGHRAAVMCAAFSPNNQGIVTASRDGTAKLWSVDNGRCMRTFHGHDACEGLPPGARDRTISGDR